MTTPPLVPSAAVRFRVAPVTDTPFAVLVPDIAPTLVIPFEIPPPP